MCPLKHELNWKSFFVKYLVTARRLVTNIFAYIYFLELNSNKEIPNKVIETVTISLFKNAGHDLLNNFTKH